MILPRSVEAVDIPSSVAADIVFSKFERVIISFEPGVRCAKLDDTKCVAGTAGTAGIAGTAGTAGGAGTRSVEAWRSMSDFTVSGVAFLNGILNYVAIYDIGYGLLRDHECHMFKVAA